MTSIKPTTRPATWEAVGGPYLPSNPVAPRSQPPLNFINLGNQAQSGQPSFITSPEIAAISQQGQGSVQTICAAAGTATTKFKEEAKTLGAIQIVIGLMHIGFGIVLGLMNTYYGSVAGFGSITFIGGYPFWGGLSFVITGALSVSACAQTSLCLIKGSLGMNIVSAIFAFIGVILLLVDESINGDFYQDYFAVISGKGISAMLILFSLSEFCITVTTAYFAGQVINTTGGPVLQYAPSPLTPGSSLAPPRNDGHPVYANKY